MTVTVAVITAAYGGHQPPAPLPAQTVRVEEILVTDRPIRGRHDWTTKVECRSHLTPRMAAKIPKFRPDWYTDAEHVIWMDAQFTVRSARFVEWCLDSLGNRPIAALRHPRRKSLAAEAKAGQGSEGRGRFAGQDTIWQAAHYLKVEGHPDDWGLWATGLHVRHVTPATVELGRRWLEETTRWGAHDQVSFPYVARETVGHVVDLPWLGWSNSYFQLTGPKTTQTTGRR